MEAVVIREVQQAPEHRQNQMMILLAKIGVCNMDHRLIDNGDNVLDQDEALALVKLATFDFEECDPFYWKSLLWLFLTGMIFRIIALAALELNRRRRRL